MILKVALFLILKVFPILRNPDRYIQTRISRRCVLEKCGKNKGTEVPRGSAAPSPKLLSFHNFVRTSRSYIHKLKRSYF